MSNPNRQPKSASRSSRKARRSRRDERKERVTHVIVSNLKEDTTVLLGDPVDGVTTLTDAKTGKPFGEGMLQTGVAYSRGNKPPKFLSLASEGRGRIYADFDQRLRDYDHVFAVDTNTCPETGRSVTVAAWIREVRLSPDKRGCTFAFLPAIVWCAPAPSPERRGWHDTIARLICRPDVQGRVALFVDSDLAKLPAINARNEPIIGKFFLPSGYELMYAASDRGTSEYVGNLAMNRCDRVATGVMKLTAGHSDPGGRFAFVPSEETLDEWIGGERAAPVP